MSWVSKIVVPMDLADVTLAAVDLALQLAGPDGDVTVVHVLPILTDYEAGVLMSNVTDENRAEYVRAALHKRLEGPKYAGVTIKVLLGDPGHEITDYAVEEDAELILLPSHRHRGIMRFLIGSVAERVVRLATCPVLVLKHPAPPAK
jgi:nucleotide-binding universal stress UspA family protein